MNNHLYLNNLSYFSINWNKHEINLPKKKWNKS